jgi:hypothetical protein
MRLNDKNPLDLKTLVIRFEGVDCSGAVAKVIDSKTRGETCSKVIAFLEDSHSHKA